MKQSKNWSKLDNAAKIFPPTSTKADTKVFRFTCELYEDVEEDKMQLALNKTLEFFPMYKSVLKRGVFWYYLEESSLKAVVKPETEQPCKPLYNSDKRGLLFEVTYFKKRVNLEVYHALTDGTGALQFLRTLVFYYILIKHEDEIETQPFLDGCDASDDQKKIDSFLQYYSKGKITPRTGITPAYQVKGERHLGYRLAIIEGRLSVKDILRVAKENHATLTEYLCAVLIYSLHEGMRIEEEKLPIVVAMPVNLRNFFPTNSARNFFGVINISHNFSTQGKEFNQVLENVKLSFKNQLNKEHLQNKINLLSSLEHSLLTKFVPCIIKDPCLKIADWLAKKESTAQFSNLGIITMPPEIAQYIKLFDVYSSTNRVQVCMCSYNETLTVCFTSPFVSTAAQRNFFRHISEKEIAVDIISDIPSMKEGNYE